MRFNPKKLPGTALLLALAPIASATTWYVNGVSGSDSHNCLTSSTACKTIGHAISRAASGDTIRVAAAIYTENLTIGKSLTILGAGAPTTIMDGGGVGSVATISNTSAQVSLSEVTIRNGTARSGGGISNAGSLSIVNSIVAGNSASCSGGKYGCSASGGGIDNSGPLTINNSTITGNSANASGCFPPPRGLCFVHAQGGGIFNRGTLEINNSTMGGNEAKRWFLPFKCSGNTVCTADGGGIANYGTLTINNSTISGNSARDFGGGFGGGIYGTATVQNSIVANNTSGGNCYGTVTSEGYNLSSDGTCSLNGPGDMNDIDPLLGPLRNNGGPTQTMALLPGSPAIDAGNPSGCTDGMGHLLKTDQRGKPRPDKEDSGG